MKMWVWSVLCRSRAEEQIKANKDRKTTPNQMPTGHSKACCLKHTSNSHSLGDKGNFMERKRSILYCIVWVSTTKHVNHPHASSLWEKSSWDFRQHPLCTWRWKRAHRLQSQHLSPNQIFHTAPTMLLFFSNRTYILPYCMRVNLTIHTQPQVLKPQRTLQHNPRPALPPWKDTASQRVLGTRHTGNMLELPPPAGILGTHLALRAAPPLPAGNKSCGFRVGEWIHIQLGIYGDFMDPTNASLPPFSGNCTIPAVHSLHSIAFLFFFFSGKHF